MKFVEQYKTRIVKSRAYQLSKLTILFLVAVIFAILLYENSFLSNVNDQIIDSTIEALDVRDEIVVIEINDETLSEIGPWPWSRDIFADLLDVLDQADPAVVGIDILFLENRQGDAEFQRSIDNFDSEIVMASKFSEDTIYTTFFDSNNVYNGFVNFDPDSDGKIRHVYPTYTLNNECLVSFSFQLIKSYLKLPLDNECVTNINQRSGNYITNLDGDLHFRYSLVDFKTVSFEDVVNQKVNSSMFKDKIVLVGTTAIDVRSNLNDNFLDTRGNVIAGVKIHANVINTFLDNSFLKTMSDKVTYLILSLTVLFLLLTLKNIRNALQGFMVFVIYQLLLVLVGLIASFYNVYWHYLLFMSACLFMYILLQVDRISVELRRRLFIQKAFGQYLSPDLVDIIEDDPDLLKLGGERKEITILFSDIRGFTSLSEKITPEELVHLLNEYLNRMGDLIMNNKGTIDKYIGDAIMAFWNAPLKNRYHQADAIITALEMVDELEQFNLDHSEFPNLKIGIGINTDEVVVGNLGSEKRFDYTAIGDGVNLSSRLEGLTKMYGLSVLITEKTMKAAKESTSNIIYRLVDEVKVKGKTKAVKLYEPLHSDDGNLNLKAIYEEGFHLYQQGKYKQAKKVLEGLKYDEAAKLIIKRIDENKDQIEEGGVWSWLSK